MKKLSFYFFIIWLFIGLIGCSTFLKEPATEDEMKHEYIQDFTDISRDVIFDRTMKYIANNFKSAKSVIDYQDKNAGTIIAKGILNNVGWVMDKSGAMSFTLNVDIRDNKVRLTYLNLMPLASNNYSMEFPEYSDKKGFQSKAKISLDKLSQEIITAINTKSDF